MRLVYVAHKIRAATIYQHDRNIHAGHAVALELWRMGFAAISPGMNTYMFDGAAPDEVWLSGDLEMVRRCDAVVMVPGWETSVGAQGERNRALVLGIPVYYWPDDREALVQFADCGQAERAA